MFMKTDEFFKIAKPCCELFFYVILGCMCVHAYVCSCYSLENKNSGNLCLLYKKSTFTF